jgi:hypothetical protein
MQSSSRIMQAPDCSDFEIRLAEPACLYCGTGGVCRTNRKLQSIAQERTHLLILRDNFEGGQPQSGRRGRSLRERLAIAQMATLADQTSLPWPDEFPRKIRRLETAGK